MKFALIGLVIGLMIFSGMVFLYLTHEDDSPKIVPCYDKRGNEIIGAECEEQADNGPMKLVFISGLVVPLLMMLGAAFDLLDGPKI